MAAYLVNKNTSNYKLRVCARQAGDVGTSDLPGGRLHLYRAPNTGLF